MRSAAWSPAWQTNVGVLDAATFSDFAVRLNDFQQYPRELARIAIEQGPARARDYARGHERAEVRQRLSEDLTRIASVYASRAQRIYTGLEDSIDNTALVTSLFAGLALILGLAGVGVLVRSITAPLNEITRVTQAVADGGIEIDVPFADRRDEVGALSRAIAVFQQAMRRNDDLNRIVHLKRTNAKSARRQSGPGRSRASPATSRRPWPSSAASPTRCWRLAAVVDRRR